MDFVEWLKNSWAIIVAVIGGITLLWNFRKIAKDIKKDINKPLEDVREEVKKLNEVIKDKEKEDTKVIGALRSIQRTSLLNSFSRILEKGEITLKEFEALTAQVNSYVELGGNSFILELWEEVKELKKVKED